MDKKYLTQFCRLLSPNNFLYKFLYIYHTFGKNLNKNIFLIKKITQLDLPSIPPRLKNVLLYNLPIWTYTCLSIKVLVENVNIIENITLNPLNYFFKKTNNYRYITSLVINIDLN